MIKPSNSDMVWDSAMTLGNPDAKNYFIVYSDLVCPYCVAFENAIVEHEEEFQKYLEENGFEIKSSEFVRIPNDLKEVNEEQRIQLEKLLEKFEDDDDVQNVFHNMKED
jgi:transcriptional/translational regulatory protein YebC/TACO1